MGTLWLIERMTQSLSEIAARLGMSSPNCTPGVRVGMGLYGPRISAGARGLGSQESSWLSPPYWKMKMQERGDWFRVASAARSCGSVTRELCAQPAAPIRPCRRICRRRSGWEAMVGRLAGRRRRRVSATGRGSGIAEILQFFREDCKRIHEFPRQFLSLFTARPRQ